MDAEPAEDGKLIVDAARGSRAALAELYRRHAGAVATVARRMLGASYVDDLVHDVFLEVWTRAGDYDPARGSVRAFILVRARSRCLDRRKSPAFARRQGLESDAVGSTEGTAERLVDAGRLAAALERLPAEQRAVILLGYCDGLSSSEIATTLSVPVGTVKSRVHAAMQKLRADLGAATPDGPA